jgi:serine/threonine protein phosphatase PrpC
MVTVVSFTEAAGDRPNEDFALVQPHPLDPSAWLCFVADGQGGQRGGGRAARLACESALATAAGHTPSQLEDVRAWAGLLRAVDEGVRTDRDAGFATFVGLCVRPDRVTGISNGDSAALLVGGANATELTAGQPKNPPVGSGMVAGATFATKLTRPWRVLVMTDGVWKYAGWPRVIAAARMPDSTEVMDELQRAARLVGSGRFQDDFTVVLLESPRPPAAE